MLGNLLGSRRRRACLIAYAVAAITFAAGVSEQGRGSYCRRCGLTRHEGGILWYGFPIQWRVRYGDNTYHHLYVRYVSAHCRHRWRTDTQNDWEPLWLTGRVACGHFPNVLLLDLRAEELRWFPELLERREALLLLPRLLDRSRAAAILTSFDLVRNSPREDAIFASLTELRQVSSTAAENRWWARHRHLFGSQTEAHRAAH
jgi:hypothetical protein